MPGPQFLFDAVVPIISGSWRLPSLSYATEDSVVAERDMCIRRFREAYKAAADSCPDNLRWKVWLSGARSELCANNERTARKLLARADSEVRVFPWRFPVTRWW